MGKTKIEWADMTLNIVTGECPMQCQYCYMQSMQTRFPEIHQKEIRFHPERIDEMLRMRNPKTIFWGSSFEMFHSVVPGDLLHQLFEACTSEQGESIIMSS